MNEATRPVRFRAGRLIDGTRAEAITDASILVENGRIACVGSAAQVDAHPAAADATEVDHTAATVVPGLIDGHVHLAYGHPDDRGWACAGGQPQGQSVWALAAAQSALAAGVTTVRDAGSPAGVALDVRDLIEAGNLVASRVLACGPCLTTTGGHGEFIGVTADNAHELRLAVRRLAHRRPDAIKVMATGGSLDPHTNRRQPQYTVDELAALVAEAARFDLTVIAHANATEGIRRSVQAGVQTIAHCNFLAAEAGRLDPAADVVAAMVAAGTYVDLNLGGALTPLRDNDASAVPPTEDRPHDRFELLRAMPDLVARTFFSSDQFGPRVSEFPTLLATATRRWRLEAEDVVWRATGLAARALGLANLGTVTPGTIADLVALDGDLTADPDALARPSAVYSGGRLVASAGWISANR